MSVNDSSKRQDVHNGDPDFDEPGNKNPTRTLDLRPSVSQARRFEGRHALFSIPPMPPPTEWPLADGSTEPLIACATSDTQKYYGVFGTWKEDKKGLDRTLPIAVVLFPKETTNQYEAESRQHTNPHPEAAKQRSLQMTFVLDRTLKLVGGKYPLLLHATLLPLVHRDLTE